MTDAEMMKEHLLALEEEVRKYRDAGSPQCSCREIKTLRDEFAMAALSNLGWEFGSIRQYSERAYEMADAMIEARKL